MENNYKMKEAPASRPAKIATGANGETANRRVSFNAKDTTKTVSPHAERLFSQIGYGKGHAVKVSNRNSNNILARELRSLVQDARKRGDVIINESDGHGYYRCNPNDPADVAAADRMIASLTRRAYEILEVAHAMDESLHGRYRKGVRL